MKIEYNGICDRGLKRDKNQDAIFMGGSQEAALFVVADGMGGHMMGEEASRIVVEEMEKWWNDFQEEGDRSGFSDTVASIRQRLELANRIIFETYNQTETCGTTVAALFIWQERYCVISSGDSRVYRLRGMGMKQLTIDDVWENQPGISAAVRKHKLTQHPYYGKLVHAAGISENLYLNVQTDQWRNGDGFLLCSDGLYKMCRTGEIRSCLRAYKGRRNGDVMMEHILQKVYRKGAVDNISVIMAVCRD